MLKTRLYFVLLAVIIIALNIESWWLHRAALAHPLPVYIPFYEPPAPSPVIVKRPVEVCV